MNIEPGTGILFIRKDGNVLNFCSRKCRVNMLVLKRVPRRIRWTKEFHNLKDAQKKTSH
ncbi:MAG: 50S ribosomal protein L24e [Candidatus Thermoplasmatota archaeon]|nr:50S ribosomal protein L24e [Candidatus Thermoplasmatota archaeon]MCL5794417.1 50S ribosomal protein L24e [Candidatus Thermoplasmatota archaeon]